MKKTLCLLLAVMLMLASGVSLADSGIDTSKEVLIHGYLLGQPNQGFDDVMLALNTILKEKINATMQIDFIDWAELDSKYSLLLAAGQDIDWIYTADWCKYTQEATKQAFREITRDEVAKYMPLYNAVIPDVAFDQVALNGKVFMIPAPTPDVKGYGWVIRKDLAEKYGIDVDAIKSIWDMTPYLDAIKQNEPGMIPINMDNSFDLLGPIFQLMTAQDATLTDANKAGILVAFDGTEVANGVYGIFDEQVYDSLHKAAVQMKTWYDAGYINRDILSATTRSKDLFEQGVSGISNDNTLSMQSTLAKAAQNGWDVAIKLFNNENNHCERNPYTNNGIAIADASENPERTMMALDYIIQDPECNTLLQYGLEGVSYVMTEDGKVDFPEGVTAETSPYNWENTGFWFINKEIQPNRASWTDNYIKTNEELTSGILISNPNAGFTFITDNVKTEFANVQSVWAQYFHPIAVGNVSDVDAAFEELKQKLQNAGYDKVIEEAKAQYAAFVQ